MSTYHQALLSACMLSTKKFSMMKTPHGTLAIRLLDLAALSCTLACDHAEIASPDPQQLREDQARLVAALTAVIDAMQAPASSHQGAWDVSTELIKTPAHLSAAAMGTLVEALVPRLHQPVQDAIVSTIIPALAEPLTDELRDWMLDDLEGQLLQRLRGPLLERLLPELRMDIARLAESTVDAQARPSSPEISPGQDTSAAAWAALGPSPPADYESSPSSPAPYLASDPPVAPTTELSAARVALSPAACDATSPPCKRSPSPALEYLPLSVPPAARSAPSRAAQARSFRPPVPKRRRTRTIVESDAEDSG